MKKILLALVIVFTFITGVFAYFEDKEITLLRQQINIPDTEAIRKNKKEKFPAGQTLKVFLAIKHNKESERDFEEWIEKWNKNNGVKYGKLEAVDSIETADIAIVQFVTKRSEYVEETGISIGTTPKPGETKPKLRVETDRGYKRLDLPVHSFLLVKSNDLWTIVYNDVETVISDEQLLANPDSRLWSAVEKKMKER